MMPEPMSPLRRTAVSYLQFAAALVVYVLLARGVLSNALAEGRIVSASAMFAVNGPYSPEMRKLAPEGVGILNDSMIQFEPWRELQARRLAAGDWLPLWKDNALFGAPFFANGQCALLYPPHLIAAALGHPPDTNFWITFFHYVLGAAGAYLLLRHLACSFSASVLGGAIFGFCAFQAIHVLHPHMRILATLPWFLLALDRLVIAPSQSRFLAVAIIAAWQHFAGHPETTFHVQLVGGALACVRAIGLGGGARSIGARISWGGAACVIGVLIAAVQIVPFIEYLRESAVHEFRHGDQLFGKFALEAVDAMFLAAFIGALIGLCGLRSARGTWWIVLSALLFGVSFHYALLWAREEGSITPPIVMLAPDWMGDPNRWQGPDSYWVHGGHFVGPALVLAFLAFLVSPRRTLVRVGVVLLVLGALFGVRSPILSELLERLPLFSQTVNRKLSFLAPMGAALLAALAVDAASRIRELRHYAPRFALGALAFLVPIALSIEPFAAVEGPGGDALTQGATTEALLEAGGFGFEPAPDKAANGAEHPNAGKVLIHGWARIDEKPTSIDIVFRTGQRAWVQLDFPDAPLDRGSFADREVPAGARPFAAAMIRAVISEPRGWYRIRAAFADGRVQHSNWIWSEGAPPLLESLLPEIYRPISTLGWPELQWMLIVAFAVGLLAAIPPRLAPPWVLIAGFTGVLCVAVPVARRIVPIVTPEHHYSESAACRVLAAIRPQARFQVCGAGIFYSEIPAWYGLAEPGGNDAMSPKRSERVTVTAIHGPGVADRPSHLPPYAEDRINLRLLGLAGVRALLNVSPSLLEAEPAIGPVLYEVPGTLRIHQNPYWLPRARLVANSKVISDEAAQWAAVLDAPRSLSETVLLDQGAEISAANQDVGTVEFAPDGDQGDRVILDVKPADRCFLVLADTWFPGWRAYVDGEERPIRRANYAFRAVELKPGDRQVIFEYHPRSFTLGLVVSAAGALLLLVIGVRGARRASGSNSAAGQPSVVP